MLASIAELAGSRAWVIVGPPLSASTGSSPVMTPKPGPQSPSARLPPRSVMLAQFQGPLFETRHRQISVS